MYIIFTISLVASALRLIISRLYEAINSENTGCTYDALTLSHAAQCVECESLSLSFTSLLVNLVGALPPVFNLLSSITGVLSRG
jgi:hypothetical protein